MVDGRPWVASKDNPTRLLIESARRLYGTSNEELMDNAKQFAYFPVAILKQVDAFSNGTISVKFKTIGGDADRCSGILFNVKPDGDWLALRYNDTENNVALWEFHNGMRRPVRFSDRSKPFMLDRSAWHELTLTVDGASGQRDARRSAGARVHARQRARAGAQQHARPTRICFRRTTPSFGRRSPGASGCGRRPTAAAISRITSSAPHDDGWRFHRCAG